MSETTACVSRPPCVVPTRARAWCSSARPPRAGRLAVPRRTQQTRGGLDCSNHACKRLSMKRSRHPLSYAQGFCGMGRTCSLCRHELLCASRNRRAFKKTAGGVGRASLVAPRTAVHGASVRAPPRAGRLAVPRRTQQTRGGLDCSNHACKRLSMKRSRHPLSYAQGFCGMGRTCSLCRHELLPAVCTRTIKHSVARDAGLSRGMPCPHRTA